MMNLNGNRPGRVAGDYPTGIYWPERDPGPEHVHQKSGPELSLGELLLTLGRNWRTVAISLLVSTALGALYCLLAEKKYSATATLELGGDSLALTEGRTETLRRQTKEEKWAQTQVAKLQKLSIADYVLSTKGIGDRLRALETERKSWLSGISARIRGLFRTAGEEPPSEKGPYNYDEQFLRSYLKLLRPGPVYNTSLVEIVATTAEPALARDIANAHAEGFIEYTRNERSGRILESLRFLQGQADDLRERVAGSERELAQYAEENELLSLSRAESVVVKEISDLTGKLSDVTAKRIHSESMLRAAEAAEIGNTTLLDDEAIRAQRVHLKQAEAEYADLAQRVTLNYPALQELKVKVGALRSNILEQRKQALAALQMEHRSNVAEEQSLHEQVEHKKGAAFKDSRKLVRYNILRREYDSLNSLYQSVLNQLKAAQVNSASKSISVAIVEHAAIPQAPSSPNVLLVLCVAVGLGVVLGGGAVAIRRMLDHTVTSPDQVSAVLRLPTLGVVPSFAGQSSAAQSGMLPCLPAGQLLPAAAHKSPAQSDGKSASPNAASEAFRAVRTNIMLSFADSIPRVILVTSAQKEEGKTTVASNLAVTLAQAQNRTLLIDGDLRRGKLAKTFKAPVGQASLVDYLTGNLRLDEAVMPTGIESLDLMIAGRRPPNPAELVGSRKIEALISELRNQYDYIVLDSPPVLSVADALALSKIVDAVVLVVRYAASEKKLVDRAVEQLRQVQARIMGLVFNGLDATRNEGYGYAGYDRDYVATT